MMSDVSQLETSELVEQINEYESAYRSGAPLVSDEVFDHTYLAELQSREPNHPILMRVGAEPDFGEGKVKHINPMLSTEKAYTIEEIQAFIKRVSAGLDESPMFRLTPKLDGMAARFDGSQLVTRGNGLTGNDVTSAIDKGLTVGKPGVGEIVIATAYFDQNLSEHFQHPRNLVVGCISADKVNKHGQQAFDDGAIRWVNYADIERFEISSDELVEKLDDLCDALEDRCEYPTDGVVIEVIDESVKESLGSTNSHHRWQIAKKRVGESAETTVIGVEWSTGRTGRVTPTVKIEPVYLSGATLSRVTAHHAGRIESDGIGIGATVRIVRSGSVIPCLQQIVKETTPEIPDTCPTCATPLNKDGDFLVCPSITCGAQTVRRMVHFFEILGNVNGFAEKTVQKLVDGGYNNLLAIYAMGSGEFESCGIGRKQSVNLVSELQASKTTAVEDWRFLGAIGISRLGRGSSKRLLAKHPLETLNTVSVEAIQEVESFGAIVAPTVHLELSNQWELISSLLGLGFNLVSESAATGGLLEGKSIVFTGTMDRPRSAMQKEAESLGAEVQSSVRKTTTWLVCGGKVGATKTAKAEKLGVEVIQLDDYLEIINT